ncbi:hypothetical protein [Pedobacter cryoconitis]|uniref:Uncharacterized protein n=1 Tax=Pedobacter cryoconitis TaxID=188932 RepID=A0A7X0J3Q8_9SPHI|nr:hypothetical protein [Pedobacter cryoconitis]MBB6499106.1 hypothetical protein [Pedobacter cryoconitis]
MSKQSINTIKNWFKTGLKPSQLQFWDTWDSFWHKDQTIPSSAIENLDNRFQEKADQEAFTGHLTDENAHKQLFSAKADRNHQHQIGDISQLTEKLFSKQDLLKQGTGIQISADNTISAVTSGQISFGSFQIFKAQGNIEDQLQVNDWVRGFISPGKMVTAKYSGGELSSEASYTILEQIEL